MLSAVDQTGSNEANDLDFQASPTSVIDARQLKLMVKTGGHKLSSNAFEALNAFARQLTMALALQCAKISRSEAMDDFSSLGGFGSGLSTMGSPLLSDNLPWSLVMEAVRSVVPALEGWFASWYERLVQHVDLAHSTSFPSEMPCCKEIADSGTSLIHPILLISDFKGILSRHSLSVNWYAMSAICCAVNEIVQWTVGVSMKMMDAKGVGTLKRADVQGIVEKAPVFSGLQPYLDAVKPLSESFHGVAEHRRTEPSSSPHDYSIADHVIGQRISNTATTVKPVSEEMSVTELARLVNERLNPTNPTHSAPPTAPPQALPEPTPSSINQKQTRYVICTDRQFPWMHVCQGESAVFMQSTGVQTDAVIEAPSLDRASCETEMQRLQGEIESLKALLLKLLATSH